MKSSKAHSFHKPNIAALQNMEGEKDVVTISDSTVRLGQSLESGFLLCHGLCVDNSDTYEANEQQQTIQDTQKTEQNGEPKDNPKEEQKDTCKETPAVKKNRCHKCGKKLGLTGAFECRCGGIYCAVHRYSDRHECSFDYREMGANQIRRDNPVIVARKLPEI
ncbi:AN1-type zinc finger protein 6 [Drosophila miranda]|uniref:AN1-type zinc finger protein 6 n=1 Tax=Drosophila miranda TaxID=7229 RepID=UPI0007E8606E|nr:AN1-type zinc finger protein 6 [Drosophila miranda]